LIPFFDATLLSILAPNPFAVFSGVSILSGLADLFGGIILVVIGILVIVLIVAAAIVLLPAIIVAIIVWFLTGSFFYAGIAFLVVALISLIAV
jgi:hypothetical protein